MAEIWVHVEEDQGKVAPITLEILTKARTLGVDVVAIALGSAANQVDKLGEYGATKVLADARGDYSEYFSVLSAALTRRLAPAGVATISA